MIELFKLKNWEAFLTLFLIPLLIHINLHFLADTLVPTAIFILIWIWFISLWLFKIAGYFKTEHLEKFEIKLFHINLFVLNLIYLAVVIVVMLGIYNDLPILKNTFLILSKIDGYLTIYILMASVNVLVIASKILTTKRLQRKLRFPDYYKSAASFILLPIGILWIQNEILKLRGAEGTEKKNRGYAFIGVTLSLIIATILNFQGKQLVFGNQGPNELTPDNALVEKLQQQNDSIFNSMDEPAKAAYLFDAALQLYQMGKFRNAINNITSSIQIDPLNPEYYFTRAVILYEQFNQMDSAITDFTKTVELDPSDWRAYQNRGYCNYLLENYDIVLPDIDKVIEIKPDVSDAYLLRGVVKNKLNDKEGACLDLRKANSLGNGDALLKIIDICD